MAGVNADRGARKAFWTCAGFTLFSAVVSAVFSLLALGMAGEHEFALYAASRSVALALATVAAMVSRSQGGVTAMALVNGRSRSSNSAPRRKKQSGLLKPR
jgi:hypothetical protein